MGAPFAPLHVSALAAEVPESIDWLVHRLVPKGVLMLLTGYMKTGKSTLAYDLVVAVAQDRAVLDRQTLKGGVLILAVEEHRRDVMNRLRHYGYGDDDPIWIEPAPVQDDSATLKALEEFIRQNGIVLVLIDTFASFFAIKDETDNAELTRRLKPILAICRSTETVIAILHHERKSGGEGGRAIRGGGAIFALVDQALQLEAGSTPTQRRLKIEGRYKGDVPSELVLDFVDGHYVCRGTPEDRDRAGRMAKVSDVLPSDRDGFTITEAARAAGLSYGIARGILDDLHASGRATRSGTGKRGSPFRYARAASAEDETRVQADAVETPA